MSARRGARPFLRLSCLGGQSEVEPRVVRQLRLQQLGLGLGIGVLAALTQTVGQLRLQQTLGPHSLRGVNQLAAQHQPHSTEAPPPPPPCGCASPLGVLPPAAALPCCRVAVRDPNAVP